MVRSPQLIRDDTHGPKPCVPQLGQLQHCRGSGDRAGRRHSSRSTLCPSWSPLSLAQAFLPGAGPELPLGHRRATVLLREAHENRFLLTSIPTSFVWPQVINSGTFLHLTNRIFSGCADCLPNLGVCGFACARSGRKRWDPLPLSPTFKASRLSRVNAGASHPRFASLFWKTLCAFPGFNPRKDTHWTHPLGTLFRRGETSAHSISVANWQGQPRHRHFSFVFKISLSPSGTTFTWM